ncbi:hypothetical protein [Actinomyces sp.]|uniref:hypothetical protein n=1 Tax=Actinomyces sp. TaxID=29317 RepID=UPI0026DC553C|nr:hypothetical protein [Actinomyces sp.]MDO4899240.1 hypothetical protein [Actinomyces sp.]
MGGGVQGSGYTVGYAVAGDLLDGGNDVFAECVNPLPLTRDAWRETARTHPQDAAAAIRAAARAAVGS